MLINYDYRVNEFISLKILKNHKKNSNIFLSKKEKEILKKNQYFKVNVKTKNNFFSKLIGYFKIKF